MNTTSKVALTTANKDAERSNLNGKVEYLSLALPLNTLFLLLVFIGFHTCKVRFGISYTKSPLLLRKRSSMLVCSSHGVVCAL